MRILLTGAGGPAAIEFMRGALDAAPPVTDVLEVHMADMDPLAAGLYLVPEAQRALVPAGRDAAFLDEVVGLCRDRKIDVFVPTVDVELLGVARNLDRFRELGCKVLLANEKALASCLDKAALMDRVAGSVPEAVAPWWILGESLPGDLTFPLIAKPRAGSGSRGIHRVETAAGLDRLPRDESYLLQTLLAGAEYSVDVLADTTGHPLVAVPRERLKVDSGIAVTAVSVEDKTLQDLACKIVKALGLAFVSNVQFKRDVAGIPRLLEINPRFPGTMPLTIRSGVNMPALALGLLLGQRPQQDQLSWRETAIVRTWQDHKIETGELQSMMERRVLQVEGLLV